MKQPLCCISHEFQRVALSHPGKIAVIHASGGVQLFRQLHGAGGGGEADDFFQGRATSSFPPMYEADRCFTYSQLLASVDSLSSRLLATVRGPQLNAPTAPRPGHFFNSTEF
uniref:AMP-dependent synthetase/ligase domain-containing protein n=1 Tax=Cucumis sativus TaxID=3659 RepID=A0A0A0LKZ4_CUCSA